MLSLILSTLLIMSTFAIGPFGDSWQNTFCKIAIYGINDLIECNNMKDTFTLKAGNSTYMTMDNSTKIITIGSTAINGTVVNTTICTGTDKFSKFNATTGDFDCTVDDTGTGGDGNTAQIGSAGLGLSLFANRENATKNNLKGIDCTGIINCSANSTDILITATSSGSGIVSIDGDISSAQTFQGVVGNTTVTDNGLGTHTFNLGDLVVMVNGAAQTISKALTVNSLLLGGTMDSQGNTIDNVGILISNAATPASSGALRFGNGETIGWRNAGNTNNKFIFVDASDRIAFNTGALTDYTFSSSAADFGSNDITGVNAITTNTLSATGGGSSDVGDTGAIRISNNQKISMEASPSGTDGCINFDSNEIMYIEPTCVETEGLLVQSGKTSMQISGNQEYSFNSTHFDVSTNKIAGSMGCTDGDFLQLGNGDWDCRSITNSTVSGLPTVLNSDVTCTQTASYCTVFTVPLTASNGNVISFHLMADTNTGGLALQFRGRADDGQATGTCTIIAQSTATAQTIDNIAVGTAPADDGNTVWFAGANIAQYEDIQCVVEADASSPQNLILEYQMEGAGTGTVQKGSNYIKTP